MNPLRRSLIVAAATAGIFAGPRSIFAQSPVTHDVAVASAGGDLLGATFESESAGISLRLPAGFRQLRSQNSGDDVGQFGDAKRKWELKVTRIMRDKPTALASRVDDFGKPIPGLLEQTVTNLRRDLSGSVVLRQDLINIADPGLGEARPGDHKAMTNNVGMIAIRYGAAGRHFLSQQAIIQATDRLYYLITLTNPVPETAGPNAPPSDEERTVVKTFRQMLDTVRLLDTAGIRKEQDERLVRTRRLLLEIKARTRLQRVLTPEQWLRIMRNGRDIGYSYITEQQSAGVPKPRKAQEVVRGDPIQIVKGDGYLIGIRSRTLATPEVVVDGANPEANKPRGPIQIDNATWLFVSPDQKLEDWSRITVVDDGTVDKDGKPEPRSIKEFGSSTVQTKTEIDLDLAPSKQDPKQPPAVIREHHRLDVTTLTDTGSSEPISQELPVFYIPQATGHLLARLLPLTPRHLNDERTYMFATYVPDTRQVMSRYVEVGDEGDFDFAGQNVRAIPINDRVGWRGSVTTHYMTRDGRYLGSENKDTHTVIIPTDAPTLSRIWHGANLTPPGDIQRPNTVEARPAPATQPLYQGVRTLGPELISPPARK